MSPTIYHWTPVSILALGAVFTVGLPAQRSLPLRAPLDAAVPTELVGYQGRDVALSEGERQATGVTDYLMRVYSPAEDDEGQEGARLSVYIGYYDSQSQGKAIHSPKNCLPGSGWEPLSSRPEKIVTPSGPVTVNRYLLQHGDSQALVLYWYQGRGRVAANEYVVKWDLLRDAALRRRSDEALVRILVPVVDTEDGALEVAAEAARVLIPALETALPA